MGFLFLAAVLGIWYTYFGYPLLLGIFASLRLKRVSYPLQEPIITLLIAAYNEESSIISKLENSLLLDYPREKLQIIVAADGSNDKTPDLVKQFANRGVELSYYKERRGKMAAINHAMELVCGEVVVFSDANNIYETGALKSLVAPFGDNKIGAVSGAKIILKGGGALGDSEAAYWKYESWIKKQETRLGCTTGVSGEIWAIRRELFEQPPSAIINDDFYMAMRIIKRGYRMVYVPDARSFERVSSTLQDERTRRIRIIAGRFQAISRVAQLVPLNRPLILWEVISHKFLRPIVPLGMIVAFLANLLMVIWPSPLRVNNFINLAATWNWVFMDLQVTFYLLALLGMLLPIENRLVRLLYLPAFLVNSNIAALLGFFRYITGSQSTLWTRLSRRG